MADPDHVPELDDFDRLTVGLYRVGLVGQAVALALIAAGRMEVVPPTLGPLVLLATVALSVGNLHLYSKRIRWVIHLAGWTGAVFTAIGAGTTPAGLGSTLLVHAGLGFLFVVTSALALKEQFCFRLPGLRAVPAALAVSVATGVLGYDIATAGLVAFAAVMVGVLAVAKLRMPVHFDVGNKSAYQI